MTAPRTYRVEHTTTYRYSDDVTASYGRAHLLPRRAPGQRVAAATVEVSPEPDEQHDHVDYFGNLSTFYAVRRRHRDLRVSVRSEVTVERAAPEITALDRVRWEDARPTAATEREWTLDSPAVRRGEALRAYADASFTPGRGLGSALRDLLARIHADFEYRSGATGVDTTLAEVMRRRRGVCQDFAHVATGCLRAVGLPTRYVSGYLETDPPPGAPKLQGADASHAWASVLVPGTGWVDLDPTNDQFVDDRYVVAAWGRDYTDVPPLKGVIRTDATESSMQVAVDVVRLG